MAEQQSVHDMGDEGPVGGELAQVPTDEWTAAALAHASILLTVVLGPAGGAGALIGPLIPLVIALGYRQRSRYVAFHALQSFIYQVVGVLIGVPVYTAVTGLLTAGTVIAYVITVIGFLALVLPGLLLVPIALLLTLVTVSWVTGVPLAWLGYGLFAAYQTYQGADFRYPLIGDWLAKEMGG